MWECGEWREGGGGGKVTVRTLKGVFSYRTCYLLSCSSAILHSL